MRARRTKVINKGLKFRLYPTPEQEALLRQHGGNARFLWNSLLALNQIEYKKTGKFIFSSAMQKKLPKMKRESFPFLAVSHSQSLQQVCKNLDKALRDCFSKSKGFPKFKRKGDGSDSFTIHQKWKHRPGDVGLPRFSGQREELDEALSISPEIREGVGERGDVLSGAGLMALS